MILHGDIIFEEYSTDNYCFNNTQNLEFGSGEFGSGSLYNQIPRDDDEPYVRTRISVISLQGGTVVWAVGHLHAGGVNTTLRINVEVVCNAGAVYGTVGGEGGPNTRNERNHLTRIEPCLEIEFTGVCFDAGNFFTTESFYCGVANDGRFVRHGAAGKHKKATSMVFVGVVFEGDAEYLTKSRMYLNLWNDLVHVADLF